MKHYEAVTLGNISSVYEQENDYNAALQYAKLSLIAYRNGDFLEEESNELIAISRFYQRQGSKNDAIECLQKARALKKKIGDNLGEYAVLHDMAMAYRFYGDYDAGMQCAEQGLLIQESIGDENAKANTINLIGVIYADKGNDEKSLCYYNQALAFIAHSNNKELEVSIKINIGVYHIKIKEYDMAISVLQQAHMAYKDAKEINAELLDVILSNLGVAYRFIGKYSQALFYLKESLERQKQENRYENLALVLYNIGQTLRLDNDQKNAIPYLINSYKIAKAGDAFILNKLSTLAEEIGLQNGLDGWEQLAQQYPADLELPDIQIHTD